MGSKLCPECLSSVDAEEPRCPHCDADLGRPRRRRLPVALALVAALAAGGYWVWRENAKPLGKGTAAGGDVIAAATADGAAADPETPPPRRGPAHHWVLRTETHPAEELLALALRDDSGGAAVLFLPLAALPMEGGLRDHENAPLEVKVLTHSLEFGFVLLSPTRGLPEHVEPLPVAASRDLPAGTEVTVQTAALATGVAILTGRSADGRELATDRDLLAGAVLMRDGAAVGYVDQPRRAIPLDRVLPWLGQTGTRNLAGIRHELAEWSPSHLRRQVEELLTPPTSAERLRRAVTLLTRLAQGARGREAMQVAEAQLRDTHLRLVRLLAETDRAEALREARLALARFPTHAPLVADAVVLSLDGGAPDDAIQLYHQLLALSPEHAERVRDDLARGLRLEAEERREGQRVQEALDLLAEAVVLFPERADLHAARAKALADAELVDAALAAAQTAARLDPTYQSEVERYRRAAEQPADPSRLVRIPFDPATGSIRAEVRVGNEPVQLVVDTGATLTTLPVAVLQRLGLLRPGLPLVKVTTASGTLEAPMVRVPELTIGTIHLQRVRAVALDLPGDLAGKGLLGLNVLRRLNMQLDSENGVLLLEKRRERRR